MDASAVTTISRGRNVEDSVDGARLERLRMAVGGALALTLLTALVGLSWDIRWHALIGRDRFLTPPHVLLYSGVTLSGLISVAAVVAETWRFRQCPDASRDDPTLVQVFRVFHAPLGVVLCGFGMLTLLTAAPFDNWWHGQYGIDVTLWAPFHMMGLIGGAIGCSGLAFLFTGSAGARERHGGDARVARLGLAFSLALLVDLLLIVISPALYERARIGFDGAHLALYPLLATLVLPLPFVAATVATQRRISALLVFGWYLALTLLIELLVPWGVRVTVVHGGYTYRDPGAVPYFSLTRLGPVLPVLGVAVSVALVAGALYRTRSARRWRGLALVAVAAAALSVAMLHLEGRTETWYQLAHVNLATLLVASLCGVLSVVIGYAWGRVLRESHA